MACLLIDINTATLLLLSQLKAKVAAEEALAAVVTQQQQQQQEAAARTAAAAAASSNGVPADGDGSESGSGGSSTHDTPVSHAARTVSAVGAELRQLEEELERRLDRILSLEEEVGVISDRDKIFLVCIGVHRM